MEKCSQKRGDPEEKKGEEPQVSSRGFEIDVKHLPPKKRYTKLLSLRKREASANGVSSEGELSFFMVPGQVRNPVAWPEEKNRSESQISSRVFEVDHKHLPPKKRYSKILSKRKREAYSNEMSPEGESSPLMAPRQVRNPIAFTSESGDPLAVPPTRSITVEHPVPPPSSCTIERDRAEVRGRRKRRRTITSNGDSRSSTESVAESKMVQGHNALHNPSQNTHHGNPEQKVTGQEDKKVEIESSDSSVEGRSAREYPRLLPDSSLKVQNISSASSLTDSSSSASAEESQGSYGGNDGVDERQDNSEQERDDSEAQNNQSREEGGESDSESDDSSEESDDDPPPPEYREEFRERYRQLAKQETTEKRTRRTGRRKRTLTGPRPSPEPNTTLPDSIWRLCYETGCLPGGPSEFIAPKRQDCGVYEDLYCAGSFGFNLMAEKLGYDRREMLGLGGYQIELETDDRLEMSWCPPESEYSRVIVTRLPSNAGRWVVDVESGVKYDGSRPFQMPKWRTSGPFQTIEDAVLEAKKQVGAGRGWDWEQVAMDGAFEINQDNSTGWKGHWNPPGYEYSHVTVKMVGRLEPEENRRPLSGSWRSAFFVKRPGIGNDGGNRVKWGEKY